MKQVKYILVNETSSKNAGCDVTYHAMPHLGYCVECFASSRFQVHGSKERAALLAQLCELRRHWPDAKILGVSELDLLGSHAPVRVSEEMNRLRREMSDLP